MDCREKELLAAYADGELSPAESEAVGRHLADCAECRAWMGLLKRSYAALEAIEPVEVPPGLAVAVRNRTTRRYVMPLYVTAGLAAAAAILLVLAVAFHPETPESANVAVTPSLVGAPEEVVVATAVDMQAAEIEDMDALQELELLEDFDMFAEFESLDDLDRLEIAIAI